MIEVEQTRDGVTIVKREFALRENRLELFRETRVSAGPQSNGEFHTILKVVSHPAALAILQEKKIRRDLDCNKQEVDAVLQRIDDVSVEQEESTLPNPLQRMFYGEEEFAKLVTRGTQFNADQVLSITSLVGSGKTLSPATLAYMYDRSIEETEEFALRLTHYYSVRYVNGHLESLKKKGLEALYDN